MRAVSPGRHSSNASLSRLILRLICMLFSYSLRPCRAGWRRHRHARPKPSMELASFGRDGVHGFAKHIHFTGITELRLFYLTQRMGFGVNTVQDAPHCFACLVARPKCFLELWTC